MIENISTISELILYLSAITSRVHHHDRHYDICFKEIVKYFSMQYSVDDVINYELHIMKTGKPIGDIIGYPCYKLNTSQNALKELSVFSEYAVNIQIRVTEDVAETTKLFNSLFSKNQDMQDKLIDMFYQARSRTKGTSSCNISDLCCAMRSSFIKDAGVDPITVTLEVHINTVMPLPNVTIAAKNYVQYENGTKPIKETATNDLLTLAIYDIFGIASSNNHNPKHYQGKNYTQQVMFDKIGNGLMVVYRSDATIIRLTPPEGRCHLLLLKDVEVNDGM